MGTDEHLSARLPLEIHLLSGLHIGTGLGLGQILDDRTVQGPHPMVEGAVLPYIPGSSLKGRLRFHARVIGTVLFGAAAPTLETILFGDAEQPGGLRFGNAYLADLPLARRLAETKLEGQQTRSERSFVSLSRQRRVARDERLFRIELSASDLIFATTLEGALPVEEAESALALLLAACAELTHLGGHKGRGLGHCRIETGAPELAGKALDRRKLLEIRP
jgi:CRISPR/Cas system CSM-associated protein Csm3 (group 7 of RAMP superfamily)